MGLVGCGKDEKDYKSVAATEVWEESAIAMSTTSQIGGELSDITKFSIDAKISISMLGLMNETTNMKMGADLTAQKIYITTNLGMNSYFVDNKMYYSTEGVEEGSVEKYWKDYNFSSMLNEEVLGDQTALSDFSNCETYEEFESALLASLQNNESEDFADFFPGITQINLSGKKYDDGRVGLIVSAVVETEEDGSTLACSTQMEYISRNGTITQTITNLAMKVDGVSFMSMSMTMNYNFGVFDETQMPTQAQLAEYIADPYA